MVSLTESNRLNDILKAELDNYLSREAVVVLSGEDLTLGAVVGKITNSTPTTGTAGAGNTGDGTCTGVTAGDDVQIGDYVLACASVPTGDATVPTTGTADAGNTGDGTCTGVTGGTEAQIGTYELECISVPTGDATVPTTGTADAGNTGDGTCTGVTGGTEAQIGVYTLTCTAESANAGTFQVMAPDGSVLPDATVAVAYTNAQINFTLNDGAEDFDIGDIFTITVTEADHDLGTFQVMAPDGSVLPPATVDTAYTNDQINFTINDGTTDFVVGDKFTIAVTEADHDLGTFSVTAPNGEKLPDATADTAYTNAQINFTINDGATDFAVGDTFTITVAAGSGKVVEIDFSAVDGSQNAAGFVIADYDASSADVNGVAIVRMAAIISDNLVWPTGATTDQKTAALAQLAAAGIVEREQA